MFFFDNDDFYRRAGQASGRTNERASYTLIDDIYKRDYTKHITLQFIRLPTTPVVAHSLITGVRLC